MPSIGTEPFRGWGSTVRRGFERSAGGRAARNRRPSSVTSGRWTLVAFLFECEFVESRFPHSVLRRVSVYETASKKPRTFRAPSWQLHLAGKVHGHAKVRRNRS